MLALAGSNLKKEKKKKGKSLNMRLIFIHTLLNSISIDSFSMTAAWTVVLAEIQIHRNVNVLILIQWGFFCFYILTG